MLIEWEVYKLSCVPFMNVLNQYSKIGVENNDDSYHVAQ